MSLEFVILVSWIKHLPPACWSTFWKSNFKQQLGCRFDIMDNESYFFVFWHMQLYMSWYIRSFFGFAFWNILYFFKYSCTNIFHRRSLYTFYYLTKYLRGFLWFSWFVCVCLYFRVLHTYYRYIIGAHGNAKSPYIITLCFISDKSCPNLFYGSQ